MKALLLAMVLACSGGSSGDLTKVDPGKPAMSTWLDGEVSDGGGRLVVQVSVPDGADVELTEPEVEGLVFTEDGEPRVESLRNRSVLTRRYLFTGNRNSYELAALQTEWTNEDASGTINSDPLWIDIGVEGPDVGELADIQEPRRIIVIPWTPIGAILAVLLSVALVLLWRARTRVVPEPIIIRMRPDRKALLDWTAARESTLLTDYERAVELSRIFRTYAEAVLAFPAQKYTTTETLSHLTGARHLPEDSVPQAKRLLRATDFVKYADDDISSTFFTDLDTDLKAFIRSTSPHDWQDRK